MHEIVFQDKEERLKTFGKAVLIGAQVLSILIVVNIAYASAGSGIAISLPFLNIYVKSYRTSLFYLGLVTIMNTIPIPKKGPNLYKIGKILISCEAYLLLILFQWYPIFVGIILGISLVISVVVLVRFNAKNNKHMPIKKRRRILSRTIVTLLFVLWAAPAVLTYATVHTNCRTYIANLGEKQSAEEDACTVFNISEEQWNEMGIQERLDLLQIIVSYENEYLGIKKDAPIVRADVLSPQTMAEYTRTTNTITIQFDHLLSDPYDDVIESVCHEMFHAYEIWCVRNASSLSDEFAQSYMGSRIEQYVYEFSNYERDDPDLYYNQAVERDARNYAAEEVERLKNESLSQ